MPRSERLVVRTAYEMRRWRHPFTVRTRGGLVMHGNTEDLIQRDIYMFGVWEPNLNSFLQVRLKPGDVFVDVGANIGYFTLVGSAAVRETGRVVSIEASPTVGTKLVRNIEANACSNVRFVHEAVFRDEREITLYLPPASNIGSGSTTADPSGSAETLTVRARPLASILTEFELTRLRAIKIDIEGGEMDALLGLLPILDRVSGELDVILEISPVMLAKVGYMAEDVLNLMADNGFFVSWLPNDYRAVSYLQPISAPIPHGGQRITDQLDFVFTRPAR
jgi:FkbM family methyltransferase